MPAPLNETPAVWRAFLPVFITSCEAAGYDSYGLHRATLASARYGKYSTRPLVWAQHSVTAANSKSLARKLSTTYVHFGVWPDAPGYEGERFDRSEPAFDIWQSAAFASGGSLGKGVFIPMLSLFLEFDSAEQALDTFDSMSIAELLLHYHEPIPPNHGYSSFDSGCKEFDGTV